MTTCGSCSYLRVDTNKAGQRVLRKHRVYECTAPVPQPPLPLSMIKAYNFHWPLSRSWMESTDGEGCPFYLAYHKVLDAHRDNTLEE